MIGMILKIFDTLNLLHRSHPQVEVKEVKKVEETSSLAEAPAKKGEILMFCIERSATSHTSYFINPH